MRAEGQRFVLAREPVGPAEMGDGRVVDAEDLGNERLGFFFVGVGAAGLPGASATGGSAGGPRQESAGYQKVPFSPACARVRLMMPPGRW